MTSGATQSAPTKEKSPVPKSHIRLFLEAACDALKQLLLSPFSRSDVVFVS